MKNFVLVKDFVDFLNDLPKGGVDLVLTDPPYAISRETNFANGGAKEFNGINMDFGDWDHAEINLDSLACASYRALRKGGTIICFYDIWKLTKLADALKEAGFKQLRFIEWVKTNPAPINGKRNYLTNAREVAIVAVKGGKPTFHGNHDKGIYHYPTEKKDRVHPTQKSLRLFEDLVLKHSNEGDLIVDPFIGSGTAGIAAVRHGRRFLGCDIDIKYAEIAQGRIQKENSLS